MIFYFSYILIVIFLCFWETLLILLSTNIFLGFYFSFCSYWVLSIWKKKNQKSCFWKNFFENFHEKIMIFCFHIYIEYFYIKTCGTYLLVLSTNMYSGFFFIFSSWRALIKTNSYSDSFYFLSKAFNRNINGGTEGLFIKLL